MELIILGSGAAFARATKKVVRNPAGYAVRVGQDILLFDLGFGNLRQLVRAGLNPAHVTDVFLSHRHPDHLGDLTELLFMLHYDIKPRSGRLRLWGPPGLKVFIRALIKTYTPWLTPRGYQLEVRELSEIKRARGNHWTVSALTVPHPTPAFAYRLEQGTKSFVYSGDTGVSDRLAEFARDCDLFLIECAKPRGDGYSGHLCAREALAYISDSRCRCGVLTHLSEGSAQDAARLLLRFPNVTLARDLMRRRI